MAPSTTPNQYDLQGPAINLSYSGSSLTGRPQLTLKKGRKTLTFSGDDITVLGTQVGTLITVSVAAIPDQESTTFSVLLPAIQLSNKAKQSFNTIGLTTVHKTTIAGPPKGVQQTYKTVALRGSAQHVEFLAQRTAGV
jgi:hypothetical protein